MRRRPGARADRLQSPRSATAAGRSTGSGPVGLLRSRGGVVEKSIGDAVVGASGVPEAHEDDVLRAVRAALEMRGAAANLDLLALTGHAPAARAAGDLVSKRLSELQAF